MGEDMGKLLVDIKTKEEDILGWLRKSIHWLTYQDYAWSNGTCDKSTCAESPCVRCKNRAQCTFNTARAVWAISRALPRIAESDKIQTIKTLEIGVRSLCNNARRDSSSFLDEQIESISLNKKVDPHFWWSSDIEPLEVTRTTSVVVSALANYVIYIENLHKRNLKKIHNANPKHLQEAYKRICNGIWWIIAAQNIDKKIICEATPSPDGYHLYIEPYTWTDIPIHVSKAIRDKFFRGGLMREAGIEGEKESDLIKGIALCQDPNRGEGEICIANRLSEEVLKIFTGKNGDPYLKIVQELIGNDCLGFLIPPKIQTRFEPAVAKECLMAISDVGRVACKCTKYKNCKNILIEREERTINTILKHKDRRELWSNVICMNLHVCHTLLNSEKCNEKIISDVKKVLQAYKFRSGSQDSKLLDIPKKFEDDMRKDVCFFASYLLTQSMLMKWELKNTKNPNELLSNWMYLANKTTTYLEENNLTKGSLDYHQASFGAHGDSLVPQTSWIIYSISELLDVLNEFNLTKPRFKRSKEISSKDDDILKKAKDIVSNLNKEKIIYLASTTQEDLVLVALFGSKKHWNFHTKKIEKLPVPYKYTPKGIAENTKLSRNRVYERLDELITDGCIIECKTRATGYPSKVKAFFHTEKGKDKAADLLESWGLDSICSETIGIIVNEAKKKKEKDIKKPT